MRNGLEGSRCAAPPVSASSAMRQLLSARVRLLEMEDGPPSLQEEVGAIAACAKGAQMPVDSASKRDTDTMAEAAGAETAAIVEGGELGAKGNSLYCLRIKGSVDCRCATCV